VPLLKAIGVYTRGMGLHALRHGYVSLLASLGEDPHYISRQVGHSSVRLTQDVYRHTFTRARTQAMQRLNDAVSPAKTAIP
jgi:integrase